MNGTLKWLLAAAVLTTAITISSGTVFARGGAANIMNSPGYQRRLQESRQQLPQPELQPSAHRHKSQHLH
jgi:hypothetical protein